MQFLALYEEEVIQVFGTICQARSKSPLVLGARIQIEKPSRTRLKNWVDKKLDRVDQNWIGPLVQFWFQFLY